MRCKFRVFSFQHFVIASIILLYPTFAIDAHTKFDSENEIENEMLKELSAKLTPVQCWLVSSYLVQQTSDPLKTGKEISHIGGHSTNFKCYKALEFWKESILPISEESNEIKGVEGISNEKRLLARAVSFAGRIDLSPWIETWSISRQLLGLTEGEANNLVPSSLTSTNDHDMKGQNHQETSSIISKKQKAFEEALNEVQKDDYDELIHLPALNFEEVKEAVFMEEGFNSRAHKKRIDSETEFYASILKYVVASVVAFVILCFAVTTLMLCIRPRPAPLDRRPNRGIEAEEFGEEFYGQSGVSLVFGKKSQEKDQQDKGTATVGAAVIVDLNGNNGRNDNNN